MKTILRSIFVGCLLMCTSVMSAQQVNTLYFLENAPMRHTINPAFQPVSKFYLTLPVIGYTSVWAGTNGWTMSDFIFKGPDGSTITPLHPNAPDNWLDKRPKTFAIDADLSTNLFGFGFRIKKNGYLHINMTERVMAEAHASSSIFGLNDMTSGTVGPMNLGVNAWGYTEYALGYSHKITRQWTVGGKIKVLIGNANVNMNVNDLKFSSSLDSLQVTANGTIRAAAPLNWRSLPTDPSELADYDIAELFSNVTNVKPSQVVMEMLNPAGVGVAFDLGATYKPIEQLQISASVTDLGFMRWHRLASAEFSVDTTFTGVDLNYGDYGSINDFDSDNLKSDVQDQLTGYTNAVHVSKIEKEFPYLNMLTANLNIGIDANFWKNRVGIGVYSRTRFYNSHITEEVTLGAAFRPVNWFNLAASYSFINGKWSNVGAGLSIAPYDGLMLTVATDYIPTTYAKAALDGTNVSLPYKTAGVNVMVGLAIVVGTNNRTKDKDKDGVVDQLDVCPNTPLNVLVTELGCPIDSDGDGVADYQDECPHTSSVAYGFIDSIGCPSDDDRDGVPNYRDECPQTPAEAVGMMAVTGCPLDSDGDGIYDYLDKCPETPAAAYGKVDSTGCPIDTDNDGVYDFLDLCPDTPVEARDMVDEHGCPLDSDKDGVYDYLDECPETPAAARNFVDSVGCFLDTDGDGVYDYEDQCPTIAGVKENLGCPEIKREVRNLLKRAMSGIHFEHDKATIKPNSYKILNDIAKVFIENPTYMVEVQGHTDNVGKYDYNIDLSDRRAHAVRTYLIKQGVPAERLTAQGYGPARPIDDNNTQAGRAKNRRVEFNIVFEEVTYETIYDRVQNNNK